MENTQVNKVLIVGTQGLTTNLLYETIRNNFTSVKILMEDKESKSLIIKRRIKKIGFFKTMGQIGFLSLIYPFLSGKNRIQEIIKESNLIGEEIQEKEIEHIQSVNSEKFIEITEKYNPDLIFINGTRILNKDTIDKLKPQIVNIHVGITPKYRGIHGGYWAVYNSDLDLFGTTLHFVDAGIDTGRIILQSCIQPSKKDSFKSYPILQFCEGLKMIMEEKERILKVESDNIPILTNESKLYYHPGFFQYLFARVFRGIK